MTLFKGLFIRLLRWMLANPIDGTRLCKCCVCGGDVYPDWLLVELDAIEQRLDSTERNGDFSGLQDRLDFVRAFTGSSERVAKLQAQLCCREEGLW